MGRVKREGGEGETGGWVRVTHQRDTIQREAFFSFSLFFRFLTFQWLVCMMYAGCNYVHASILG